MRRPCVNLNQPGRERELGKALAEVHQRRDDAFTIGRRQTLLRVLADLRCVQADPDLTRIGILGPEPHELLQIALPARLLPRDRAVDGDLMSFDVLEDAIVCGRLASLVVFRLKSVDGHDNLQSRKSDPFRRDRPHGAGHDLRIHSHLRESRQDLAEFPITDERFTTHDRNVKRSMLFNEREKAIDELLAFEIADLAQRHIAAEVIVAICVTTGTFERTFAGDLDREGRTITAKDSSPCGDNAFHLPDYNKGN